jgi:hypothetical protein
LSAAAGSAAGAARGDALKAPKSVRTAEAFGRVRLSPSFYMRDFLHSEIGDVHGISNLPDDPDLAIAAGTRLCEELLEPLQAIFGRIAVRSAYRSPAVNAYGNVHYNNCGSNERNFSRHIWDRRDREGCIGAMACIVVPWFADRYAKGAPWQAMAWWVHDHLPYSELQFFPKLAAFNIAWHERPKRRIYSFIPPRGLLTKPGMGNHEGRHAEFYEGFPDGGAGLGNHR